MAHIFFRNMTHSRTTVHCGAQMRAIVLFRAVYKYALTHLSLEHPFDKILLALGDGEVEHYMTPKPPSTGHNSDCPVADNMHVRIRSVHRAARLLLYCSVRSLQPERLCRRSRPRQPQALIATCSPFASIPGSEGKTRSSWSKTRAPLQAQAQAS
jgi:hypothetical protein